MAESQLQQLENGTAPLGMRMAIAEGLLPLEGDELVQALGYLSRDKNKRVREALEANLPELPRGFLITTAGQPSTSPDLLMIMAKVLIRDEEILQPIILNRNVNNRTLVLVAEQGPPSILEILAQNRNRMLEHAPILKKLLENEQLSRVTRFSLDEFRERFQVDIDVFDDSDEEATDGSSAAVVQDALAVAVEESPASAPVVVAELETTPMEDDDVNVITDELIPGIDAQAIGLEDDLVDTLGDVAVDERVEGGWEDAYADDILVEESPESIDDLEDGWNIETLVKGVAGAGTDSVDGADGFDDVLNIAVVEDEEAESEKDGWLDEETVDFARRHGLTLDDEHDEEEVEHKITDTRIRLMKMSAADKLIMAKLGTKQERAILVTDPNKKVAVAVVEGPKMSEFEIQLVASNRQVYEEVLRAIATHKKWGKSNHIRRELVLNPKTPLDISVRMLNSLSDFILKDVTKSKEIPSALASQAKRVLDYREKRRSG